MFSNLLLSGPNPKLYLCWVCLAAISLIQKKEINNNVNINNYILHVIKHMSQQPFGEVCCFSNYDNSASAFVSSYSPTHQENIPYDVP